MTDKPLNPRQILVDLANELDGRVLQDDFKIGSRTYTIRLLNEEETNWRNSHVVMSTQLATATSIRLPTVAMSVRSIDGTSIEEIFKEEWDKVSEEKKNEYLNGTNRYSRKHFFAEFFMSWLSERFPDSITPLFEAWRELEDRRLKSQGELKNSSGESSEQV